MKAARVARLVDPVALHNDEFFYRQTGNGLHAWVAYRRCRTVGADIPPWVLAYFDGAYDALRSAGGTRSPQAIAAALKLATIGGGKSARERALKTQLYAAIVQHVRAYRRRALAGKARLSAADHDLIFGRVAEETGLSTDRVRTVWYEWGVTTRPRSAAKKSPTRRVGKPR